MANDSPREPIQQAEMDGGNELEPNDSRNVTGSAHTPDGRWSGDEQKGPGGEYEPRDSRNVTGTAKTEDGRWPNAEAQPNEPGPMRDNSEA